MNTMPDIITFLCLFLVAELISIRKIARESKNRDLKHPILASVCPVLSIVISDIRQINDDELSTVCKLRVSLNSSDDRFRQNNCSGLLDELLNSRRSTLCNKEIEDLSDALLSCYSELFSQFANTLTENEKLVCILHHLGVKPQIIGEVLHISYATVRTHKARAKVKLPEPVFDVFFNSDNNTNANKQNENETAR